MLVETLTKENPFLDRSKNESGPVGLILAGYNKIDSATKKRKNKEIMEAYDEEIYMGENKFLHPLCGKPIIQYVLDAAYNAKKDGKRLYERIYIYNDKQSFEESIDVSKYDNVYVLQMKDSVGGHWKDFYFNYIDYGQRVDVFFGDTPRLTPEDVLYAHEEYEKILMKHKDHRGVPISVVFNIVEFKDLTDNWLQHRIKYIKVGKNKGKLKSFVGFKDFQARVGNGGAMIKDPCLDDIMKYQVVNFAYNLRKALTPSTLTKIMYYLWKTNSIVMIRQLKNRCINEIEILNTTYNIFSRVYKIDLSKTAGYMFHVKRNAARWENDIDGPKDYEAFQKKFDEMRAVNS